MEGFHAYPAVVVVECKKIIVIFVRIDVVIYIWGFRPYDRVFLVVLAVIPKQAALEPYIHGWKSGLKINDSPLQAFRIYDMIQIGGYAENAAVAGISHGGVYMGCIV
jgi:hypothetical protein